LYDQVKTTFDDNVVASGLTYNKTTVLQLIEAMSFGLNYIKRFTDAIIKLEIALIDSGGKSKDSESLNRGELDWFKANTPRFYVLLDYLKKPVKDIKRL